MLIGTGRNIKFGKLERGLYNLVVSTPNGLSASSKIQVPTKGNLTILASLHPNTSNKRSEIKIKPPLINQWYFWASIGGAVALSSVSAVAIYTQNQPIPAEKGDVSVTLP